MASTRMKLINLLENNRAEYISGQELSNQLDISRTAVWKHMKQLELDGYQIEAAPRKGYRIISNPDKVSQNTLQWGLETKWMGKHLHHYDQVNSTQDIGHELAKEGAPHGTVIVADEQLKGKGRKARSWHSKKGEGIWMSIILRPDLAPVQAPQITLLAATVLAQVLAVEGDVEPQIKWPNDLLIDHKKVSGILTEMQAEQDHIQYIVIGIGMNVNQDGSKFPDDIRYKASSLKESTGHAWDITKLIQKILKKFEHTYEVFLKEGFKPIKLTWEHYGYRIDETVTISTMKKKWKATLVGIEADGALQIRNEDGSHEKLYSAEIEWGEGGYHA
ncbi:biotin--[acetyl-CoA-carboxylase] ligase [Thalassobacillus hwangdonensis]|uniref:Bifunctional ligase/repressor BirA n=1 Tax=Thalassobacillus hwangdonensis TaxID=546108 RepID=A0ABW3KX53_9BACI